MTEPQPQLQPSASSSAPDIGATSSPALGPQEKGLSQIRRAEIDAITSNWRMTPATLGKKLLASFMAPQWIQMASLEIARAIYRGNGRLMFNAPPRHGKSFLVSTFTPLWVLENFPTKHVVIASYGEELPTKFTAAIRELIRHNEHLLNVRVKVGRDRVDSFETTEGGTLRAIGRRGSITGFGADVLIIDDYIKNAEEALNPSIHQSVWDWFLTTIRTRLEPNASIIVNATRWDVADLHGKIIKQAVPKGKLRVLGVSQEDLMTGLQLQGYDISSQGEKATVDSVNNAGASEAKEVSARTWVLIKFQALAEPISKKNPFPDPLGREIGEALFPERFSKEDLEEIKSDLTDYWFDAMYQQNPVASTDKVADSSTLKFIKPNDLPKMTQLRKLRSWDMASTKGKGDPAVGSRLYYHPPTQSFIIADIERGQWGAEKLESKVLECAQSDALIDPRMTQLIELEPGSASKLWVENLSKGLLKDFKVVGNPTTTKKLIRAQPLLAAAGKGQVYVLLGADGKVPTWYLDLCAEWDSFPGGAHDDQMDTLAAGYLYLSGKKPIGVSWGRRERITDDPNKGVWNPTQVVDALTTGDYSELSKAMAKGQMPRRKRVIFGR